MDMGPNPPVMIPSSKKRGFFDLPLEIREKIYAHFLHARILVHEPGMQKKDSRSLVRMPGAYEHRMKIFSISKAMKVEVNRLTFLILSEGIFIFGIRNLEEDTLPFSDRELALIKHVEYSLSPLSRGRLFLSRILTENEPTNLFASTIGRFGGSAIKRQTCDIDLRACGTYLYQAIVESLLGVIVSLVGFETITLKTYDGEFDHFALNFEKKSGISDEHLRRISIALGPWAVFTHDGSSGISERLYVFHPRRYNFGRI